MTIDRDEYVCPKCGSGNIVKLSLIYKHGLSRGSSTGTISKGMFDSVDVDVDSDRQTMASELAQPPTGPIMTFLGNIIIGFVLSIVGTFSFYIFRVFIGSKAYEKILIPLNLGYLLCIIFIVVKLIIIDSCLYARKYPFVMNRWRNSYQCQRCDYEFAYMNAKE